MVQNVPSDGNCFYSCVEEQLFRLENQIVSYQSLRNQLANFLSSSMSHTPIVNNVEEQGLFTAHNCFAYATYTFNKSIMWNTAMIFFPIVRGPFCDLKRCYNLQGLHRLSVTCQLGCGSGCLLLPRPTFANVTS
jgi:hypothetical protein